MKIQLFRVAIILREQPKPQQPLQSEPSKRQTQVRKRVIGATDTRVTTTTTTAADGETDIEAGATTTTTLAADGAESASTMTKYVRHHFKLKRANSLARVSSG